MNTFEFIANIVKENKKIERLLCDQDIFILKMHLRNII